MSKKLVGLAILPLCLSTPLLADRKRPRRQYRRAPAQFAVAIVTPYGAGFVSGGGPNYGHRGAYDCAPSRRRHYRENRYKKRFKSKKRHRHQHYCDRRH